ncbi:TetR/AcrR family transcriptional regulator C-terminal domain-containing protein [Microterricola gilva]|nr:TetR/AcrR family transcriptional regulator C-terminal domain-containing protein [Microterricola gilva]
MQSLLDRLFLETLSELTTPPADWKGRLLQIAASTLDLFTRYPAIGVEAIVISTNGPSELEIVEIMLDAFSRAGLSDHEVVRHYALYSEHLLSSAAGIARARASNTDDSDDSVPWIDSPLLVDPERHPRIASLSPQLRALDSRDLFRLGAESIIESAERLGAEAKSTQ